MNLIGRDKEIYELGRYYDSGRPELVVVYGRRRVGKTYLVREYFENNFAFYCPRLGGSKPPAFSWKL